MQLWLNIAVPRSLSLLLFPNLRLSLVLNLNVNDSVYLNLDLVCS